MSPLVYFAFTTLLSLWCEAKSVQFIGYPEENRNVNIPFSSDLLEGDMLVGQQVKKIALAGGDISKATTGRKRGATKHAIWPNGVIPYTFDQFTSDVQKNKIKKAMKEWENETCLSFVPYDGKTNIYLKIQNLWPGCFSLVGYPDITRIHPSLFPFGSTLNLGHGCQDHRVIIHELGHAIGFYHEQSRKDRDNYVEIKKDNILEGKGSEFEKYINFIDSLGSPYDLTSVMHYGPKAFSKNGGDTIVVRNSNKTLVVNNSISDLDKEQVKKLYSCGFSSV